MLPEDAETRITEVLDELTKDTGAEATIVTLSSVRFYAQNLTVAEYATALFNDWGIGDADDRDGVLLLVFRDDKELRIELGAGFDPAANDRAASVVSDIIIPSFANNDFVAGIEMGATGIADQVVRNVNAVQSTPSGDGKKGNTLLYVLGGIVAAVAALFGLNRRAKAKLAATPCTNCGVAGQLSKDRVILVEATETDEGKGEAQTICAACGHVDRDSYTIAQKRPEEDKFAGGQSKGDGASGKW
jgi:uncharacterized protein